MKAVFRSQHSILLPWSHRAEVGRLQKHGRFPPLHRALLYLRGIALMTCPLKGLTVNQAVLTTGFQQWFRRDANAQMTAVGGGSRDLVRSVSLCGPRRQSSFQLCDESRRNKVAQNTGSPQPLNHQQLDFGLPGSSTVGKKCLWFINHQGVAIRYGSLRGTR